MIVWLKGFGDLEPEGAIGEIRDLFEGGSVFGFWGDGRMSNKIKGI